MIGKPPSKQSSKPFAKKLSQPPLLKPTEEPQEAKSEQLPPAEQAGGESVRVALRLRPLNELQLSRRDESCIKVESNNSVVVGSKGNSKSFRFNYVLSEKESQDKAFDDLAIEEFIDAALEGYSATIFAYGQTGSGKTYTMAGKEEIFTNDIYQRDPSEGIIPRAIHSLWKRISSSKNNYYIKASYTEIYNEQVRDLLNLSSGVLHCRWNPSSGFFVQDLVVVDCTNVDDMIAVLHEGMQNRKSASHELNKDSSRSHSILTMYMISEQKSGSQTFKKYGKLSFVDLAGSERLKESKSQGDMIKETGNINKSLFTLGKVIKGLTDKKTKTLYIPYRDSKLTMLLMDSLGYELLQIAAYFEETLSTLNYAARTMNIKNTPVIQIDHKDQTIVTLQKEIDLLRKQNVYLRQQYERVNKGLPLKMPEFAKLMGKTSHNELHHSAVSRSGQLAPLQKNLQIGHQRPTELLLNSQRAKDKADTIIIDYQIKFEALKKQNQEMRRHRDDSQSHYQQIMNNNGVLQTKLQNLQQIFLNKRKDEKPTEELITSSLMQENTELKHKLFEAEKMKRELSYKLTTSSNDEVIEAAKLRDQNVQMQQQVEQLQRREKELLELFQKSKKK